MTQQHVAAGVDPAWVADFIQQWTDAWNSHDAEQLLALMTDDIEYEDTAWPTVMRGHGDVREFLAHAWTAFPDMRFEMREGPFVHPDKPSAAFWWDGSATHTGPLDPPGLAPTGKRLEFDGADFHEYRDGKVAKLRIVFDLADLMRKLGVLPSEGGRQEKVLTTVTNLKGKLPGRG